MSRAVADDVIAVLEMIRESFQPNDAELDVSELRKSAVHAIAQTELDNRRFSTEVSASNSILDGCVRRLGYAEASQFDNQLSNWLRGRPHELCERVLAKTTTEHQRQRLAHVLGTLDSRLTNASAQDLESPSAARIDIKVSRIIRDTRLSSRVKMLHNYECQICGGTLLLADGSRYAEGHHVQPLGHPHNGPDVLGNIICLCPNHHAVCDLGAIKLVGEQLRPAVGHHVEPRYIDYHNVVVFRGTNRAEIG
ncbi:MAG: HNH endonuclease [Planctomycetota bacterium]